MQRGVARQRDAGTIRSPIGWQLLGLLIERPSYGYELVQRFQRVYGDVISLSGVSRIYEALEELASRAMIERTPESAKQAGLTRQPKLHYRVTERGMRGYEQWLLGQLGEERRRFRLFARQLGMLSPSSALDVIERCGIENLQEASNLTKQKTRPENTVGLAERLELEDQRLALDARLSWIEYARRELQALIDEHDPPAAAPARKRAKRR